MAQSHSHWGMFDFSESEGHYVAPTLESTDICYDMVLQPTGEVLVRRDAAAKPHCQVAIVLAGDSLTAAQSASLLQAWATALEVASGDAEAIDLQPIAHNGFSHSEYISVAEWKSKAH